MHIAYPYRSATAALALAAAVLALPAMGQTPQRSLAYISEPGDPVGQGRSGSALPMFSYARADAIYITAFDGSLHYNLSLVPPDGQRLQVGAYENARGGTQAAPGYPYLEFASDQACDGSRGRFEIADIAYDETGHVVRLRVNFEQRCTGASGSLWGDVALDAGLTYYSADIEDFGAHGASDAVAYLRVQCSADTFGELRVRASQKARGGEAVTASSSRTFGCGPAPRRVPLDLSAGSASAWKPGPVKIEVTSYVNDPHYDEAARVMRSTLQENVILKPARE